jgi:arylformamidase
MPMPEPIDISVRLRAAMPVWPNSVGFRLNSTLSFAEGDDVNVSRIEMDVHCGTHVEAPRHSIEGGAPLESIPLSFFVGRARVVHLADAAQIGAVELESMTIPSDVERLLIRTRNSGLWAAQAQDFRRDYVALTLNGAAWIAERGIHLVGVDYLSIQRFDDPPETHRVLMRAGVAILEGINLKDVEPGDYRLTCLPLSLADAEAAPARAILEPFG